MLIYCFIRFENVHLRVHFLMSNLYKDKVFITLYLDPRRRRKKDDKCPLRVRIKFNDETKFYGTARYYNPEEYDRIENGKRLSVDQQNERVIVNALLERAKKAAAEPFSFERFERAWYNKGGKADVFSYFKNYSYE